MERGLTARAEAIEKEKKERSLQRSLRFPLYIRFGELPAGGSSFRSYDWKKPTWEEGISCFRGRRDEYGVYAVDTDAREGLLNMFKRCVDEGRAVYLADGSEVGEGVCGEPVLEGARLTPVPEGSRVRAVGYKGTGVSSLWPVVLNGCLPIGSSTKPPREVLVGKRGVPLSTLSTKTPPFSGELATLAGKLSLVEAALSRSTYPNFFGGLHGEEHWKRVAIAGARLSRAAGREGGEVDPLVVLLFSLFHDSARLGDAEDPWHGLRGARLAREVLEGGISGERMDLLARAVEEHDRGKVSENPTVGACWDADRLNLWRVGKKPDPRLLSTAAAKRPETIEWARGLQRKPVSWREAVSHYEDLEVLKDLSE